MLQWKTARSVVLVPAGAEQHCASPDTHEANKCFQLPAGLSRSSSGSQSKHTHTHTSLKPAHTCTSYYTTGALTMWHIQTHHHQSQGSQSRRREEWLPFLKGLPGPQCIREESRTNQFKIDVRCLLVLFGETGKLCRHWNGENHNAITIWILNSIKQNIYQQDCPNPTLTF